MRIINIDELSAEEFYISDVSSFYRVPDYTFVHEQNCPYSGFRLIESGKATYTLNKETFTLAEGALIYMPKGCSAQLTINDKNFSFSKIHFSLTDAKGEELIFSRVPFVLTKTTSQKIIDVVHTLNDNMLSYYDTILNKLCICKILKEITHFSSAEKTNKISPAIKYLRLHYREEISADHLAEICYLSKAQFHRLFKKQTGFTPIEYKNNLRIERAMQMLEDGEYSISEIATSVGFDNVFYFSKTFKKIKNIAPKDYKKDFIGKQKSTL